MNLPMDRRYWIAAATGFAGAACILSATLRPAPAEAQLGALPGIDISHIAGPVRLMRGQTARVAAFVPAALRGAPKRLDLKFAIDDGARWFVVSKTFAADADCPWAAVELQI